MKRMIAVSVIALASTGCFRYEAQDGTGTWFCEPMATFQQDTPAESRAWPGYYACAKPMDRSNPAYFSDGRGQQSLEVRIVNAPF